MYSLVSYSRVAALLPQLLQHASGAIATLATPGANTSYVPQSAVIEQRRASSAQSASPGTTSGPQPVVPVTPHVASSPLDAFQSKLQTKTEQEILKLMEEARAAKQGVGTAAEESEEEQESGEEVPNPETGELYGPRGREPTRYGDWENKGKCIDF